MTHSLVAGLLACMVAATACGANAAGRAPHEPEPGDWRSVPVHPTPVPEIEEAQATVKPRLLKPGRMQYPIELESEGISGSVRLRFLVMEDGAASSSSIRVLRTSHPAFVGSAIRLVEQSRFAPGQVDGNRVRVWVEQSINFVVRDS